MYIYMVCQTLAFGQSVENSWQFVALDLVCGKLNTKTIVFLASSFGKTSATNIAIQLLGCGRYICLFKAVGSTVYLKHRV